MTHEIQQHSEHYIKRGTLLMGAVLVGGAVEIGRAVSERRQANVAGVRSYHEDSGPAFIFMRGCGENYQAQSPILHSKLAGHGSLHFEYQVEGRHAQELIDQNVIDICKQEQGRDKVFVSTSMGLMNTMRSLANPAVRTAIGSGQLQAIVAKSGMTSRYDLQPSMQRAAQISTYVPQAPTIGDLWRRHRLSRAHGDITRSGSTTLAEARLHHESSAYMPFPLVASQYRAIHHSTAWGYGSHFAVMEDNPALRLYHITAEHDGVTDWHKTNRSLAESFGVPVETIVDERRPRGSHADDIEYIEPLQELMLKLSGGLSSSVRNLAMYSDSPQLAVAS